MKNLRTIGILLLLLLGAWSAHAATGDTREISATVLVIEGEVTAIYEQIAEGGLEVIGASVVCGDETHKILLAPRAALQEIGFRIEPGDSIRARLFSSEDDGSSRVQKILNRTRGDMVRLRTVRRDPLWDGTGHWHGSGPAAGEHGGTAPVRPNTGTQTRVGR